MVDGCTEEDFWENLFLRRVRIKDTSETGTIIDLGSVEGTFIIELDVPKEREIYFLRDYHLGALEFIN